MAYPTKRCIHSNCKELALYSLSAIPQHCEFHKEENELNIIEKECVLCKFVNIVDLEGKCSTCNPSSYNTFRLAKQNKVVKHLIAKGFIPTFIDKAILYSDCDLKTRPDIFYERETHNIIVEVDEDQHKGRPESCECARMVNIAHAFYKPTFFIRFNPDPYKKNGRKTDTSFNTRITTLFECLSYALEYTPEKLIELNGVIFMKKLYFDDFDIGNNNWIVIQ
jgi:hypothetical protein